LKGVLGVVMIADDTTANAENHRAVASNKGFKGRFVLLVDKGCQQLAISLARPALPQHGPAEVLDKPV
jgi:hypothetical protein